MLGVLHNMLADTIEQWTYLAVFILAAIPWVELIAVIPLGILINLNPWWVAILGFVGNWLTVMLLVVFFQRFRQWRERKAKGSEETKRGRRAHKIWDRYGVVGLSLLGPLIIGSHITAAVALGFKASIKQVSVWMTISLAVWSAAAAIVAYFGLDTFGLIRTDFFEGRGL